MDIAQRRKIIFLALITLCVVIGLAASAFFQRFGKIELELVVAPKTAEIKIDGKPVRHGKNYVTPGEHTVDISQNHFQTTKVTENFTSNDTLRFGLSPTDSTGRQIALNREADYLELEQAAGEESRKAGEAFNANNPIVRRLPHKTSYYSIDYRISPNDQNRVVVEITTKSALGRQVALQKIRDWGFQLSDYEYTFSGFSNPFDKGRTSE